MKISNFVAAVGFALCLFVFAGCSPDEMEVSFTAHDLSQARSGKTSYADVTVSFDNKQDSIKEKLPKIREAVKPYLGKNGKFTVRGGKITASFKAPIVTKGTALAGTDKTVARLELDKNRLQLVETPWLKALNQDLSAIDFSVDVDLKAKHLVLKVSGDESASCEVGATAVFVDGEPHVNFEKRLGADDSVDIEFRCDSDASVWHRIKPYVEVR